MVALRPRGASSETGRLGIDSTIVVLPRGDRRLSGASYLSGKTSRRRIAPLSFVISRAVASVVAALAGVFVLATAASAHENAISGVVSCVTTSTTANYSIKWTLVNSYNENETASVVNTVTNPTTGGVGSGSPASEAIGPTNESQTGTGVVIQTLPNTTTGWVTISEFGSWVPDGWTTTNSGTVEITGSCKSPSELSTTPSASAILLGGSISDSATLTDGNPTAPTGTVHFYLCGPYSSPTSCTTPNTDLGTAGVIANRATSAATTPAAVGTYCFVAIYSGDSYYTGESDNATNECFSVEHPAVTILKKTNGIAGAAGNIAAGSTVTWTYVVTNTGDTALTNETATDNQLRASAITCGSTTNVLASLAVGAAPVTCTATGTAVAGAYSNTGTVVATPPLGSNLTSTSTSSYFGASPSLSLVKTDNLNLSTYTSLNQSVKYTYTLKNTGNVTLSAPYSVTDNKIAPANVSCPTTGTIAPGASIICTGTYKITQADLDAGSVKNTATATATYGTSLVTSNQASDTIKACVTGTLSITKGDNLNPSTYNAVVQSFGYTITVTNNSNIDQTNVTVSDSPATDAALVCTVGGNSVANPDPSLASGASIICTGTHKITQADLNNGSYKDTASATSTQTPTPVTASDTIKACVTGTLSITKGDNLNPSTYNAVGQSVGYTITVTNNSNIDQTNVTVSDSPATDAALVCTVGGNSVANPDPSLASGASIICTGTHKITQADLNNGSYKDTASATSTQTPTPVTASDTIKACVTGTLSITKGDNLNPSTYNAVGQSVGYTITVTNNSNIDQTNVTVSDSPATDAALVCTVGGNSVANPDPSLASGASIICTGTHKITQADLNNGSYKDTASATSTQTPTPVTASDTIKACATGTLSITRGANLTPSTYNAVGQSVGYTITVTNNSNIDQTNVTVSDSPATDAALVCTVGGNSVANPDPSLASGASILCTGTHKITQADLNNGSYKDTASATSTQTPTPVTASDTIKACVTGTLSITKGDNLNPSTYNAVGQSVGYTITVTNNSNIDQTNVTVSDSPATDAALVCTVGGNSVANPDPSLASGASIICTGTHKITQADLNNGSYKDTASATSTQTPTP